MNRVIREVVVSWSSGLTLEEALFLMDNHDGESYIDGDRKAVVLVE